jgi:hypothetical protein
MAFNIVGTTKSLTADVTEEYCVVCLDVSVETAPICELTETVYTLEGLAV